jgi:hypothetical protein
MEWWPCQACGSSGVRVQFGPPTIHCHNFKRSDKVDPIKEARRKKHEENVRRAQERRNKCS